MANEQYRVMTITAPTPDAGPRRREVFIVPPRKVFAGFGGSRAGLLVDSQPSLIIRDVDAGSQRDAEYNVHDQRAWNAIRMMIMAGGVVTA